MAAIDIEYLQLVTRHQAAIYGYIRSLAPGVEIEDIVQETNLILWEKAETFTPGSNFKAFAFRIAHLKTLEALRAQKRGQWLIFDNDLLATIADRSHHDDAHTDGQQAALRTCLAALDPADLHLVTRRYAHRHTVRDIARETGRTEGSLQQWFFRVRQSLRACIESKLARQGGNP